MATRRRTALAQIIQQSIAQSSFVHNNLVLCRPDAIPLPVPPITRMIRHRRSWWRTWTFGVLNDALGFWQIIVTGLERHKAAARSCVLWRQTSNSCSGYHSAGGVYSRQCKHGMRRSVSDCFPTRPSSRTHELCVPPDESASTTRQPPSGSCLKLYRQQPMCSDSALHKTPLYHHNLNHMLTRLLDASARQDPPMNLPDRHFYIMFACWLTSPCTLLAMKPHGCPLDDVVDG